MVFGKLICWQAGKWAQAIAGLLLSYSFSQVWCYQLYFLSLLLPIKTKLSKYNHYFLKSRRTNFSEHYYATCSSDFELLNVFVSDLLFLLTAWTKSINTMSILYLNHIFLFSLWLPPWSITNTESSHCNFQTLLSPPNSSAQYPANMPFF